MAVAALRAGVIAVLKVAVVVADGPETGEAVAGVAELEGGAEGIWCPAASVARLVVAANVVGAGVTIIAGAEEEDVHGGGSAHYVAQDGDDKSLGKKGGRGGRRHLCFLFGG